MKYTQRKQHQHQPSRRNSKDHRRNEQQQAGWTGREHIENQNRSHARPTQRKDSRDRRQSHENAPQKLSPNFGKQPLQLGRDSHNAANDRNHRGDYRQTPQQQLYHRQPQNQVPHQNRQYGAANNPRDSHRNAASFHDPIAFGGGKDDASQSSQQSFDPSFPFGRN